VRLKVQAVSTLYNTYAANLPRHSLSCVSSAHTWRISQLNQHVGDLLQSRSIASNQTHQTSGGASSSPCSSGELTDSPLRSERLKPRSALQSQRI
jgi:hypothetical protein